MMERKRHLSDVRRVELNINLQRVDPDSCRKCPRVTAARVRRGFDYGRCDAPGGTIVVSMPVR
jgi:hypothetical protein